MNNLAPFLSVDRLRRDLIRAQSEWAKLPKGDPMRGIIAAGIDTYRGELKARTVAAGDTAIEQIWKMQRITGWA